MSKFKTFITSLSKEEREEYAVRAGTTFFYLNIHLRNARKVPRRPLLKRLAEASNGQCSYEDVVDHFMYSQ